MDLEKGRAVHRWGLDGGKGFNAHAMNPNEGFMHMSSQYYREGSDMI